MSKPGRKGARKTKAAKKGNRTRAGAVAAVMTGSQTASSPATLTAAATPTGFKAQLAAATVDATLAQDAPEPPMRLQFKEGERLRITYTLDIIVAQLTLEWLNDVNKNAKPDDGEAQGKASSNGPSTVTIEIPSLPRGTTYLQWLFAEANRAAWRGELKIGPVKGPQQTFVQRPQGPQMPIFNHWLFIDAIP